MSFAHVTFKFSPFFNRLCARFAIDLFDIFEAKSSKQRLYAMLMLFIIAINFLSLSILIRVLFGFNSISLQESYIDARTCLFLRALKVNLTPHVPHKVDHSCLERFFTYFI